METARAMREEGGTRTQHFLTETSTVRVSGPIRKVARQSHADGQPLRSQGGVLGREGQGVPGVREQASGEDQYAASSAACSVQPSLPIADAQKVLEQLEQHRKGRKRIDCKNIRRSDSDMKEGIVGRAGPGRVGGTQSVSRGGRREGRHLWGGLRGKRSPQGRGEKRLEKRLPSLSHRTFRGGHSLYESRRGEGKRGRGELWPVANGLRLTPSAGQSCTGILTSGLRHTCRATLPPAPSPMAHCRRSKAAIGDFISV